MKHIFLLIAALTFGSILTANAASTQAPGVITGFVASQSTVARGQTVRLQTALKTNIPLTKAGYVQIQVKDTNNIIVATLATTFTKANAGDTIVATGDFTPKADAPLGNYSLGANVWSPEINIWDGKWGVFNVVAPQAPGVITGFAASQTTVARGQTVRLQTALKTNIPLTKAGYVQIQVKDTNNNIIATLPTTFTSAKAGDVIVATGDFTPKADAALGNYSLGANVWSPEINIWDGKWGVFSVVAAATSPAAPANPATPVTPPVAVSVTASNITADTLTVMRGQKLTYGADVISNVKLTKTGSIIFQLENANGVVVQKVQKDFPLLAANTKTRLTQDFVVPADLAGGKYNIVVSASSPEFQLWYKAQNAFEVVLPVAGVCGAANNGLFSLAPNTGLCATGAASVVVRQGTNFAWTCAGINNGAAANCLAAASFATCGASDKQTFTAAPATGLCKIGTGANMQANASGFSWICSDTASNTQTACSAVRYVNPVKLASFTYGGPTVVQDVQQFDKWLGRKTDLYVTNLAAMSWKEILSSVSWLTDPKYYPTDRRMVIGVPMLAEQNYTGSFWANDIYYQNMSLPKGTLKQAADGVYDAQYKAIAAALVKYGRGNAIIRLGWEMNGNWQPWRAAADPANYVKAFQRIVGIFRATPGAKFEFDFNPNIGKQEISPEAIYPGDAYVDYIGQDVYDKSWSQYDRDPVVRWNNYYYNAQFGIKWLIDFAAAHGKPMSFPEFGAGGGALGNGQGGVGDSPYFITKMAEVIKGNNVAYASYWDSNEAYQGELSANQYPLIGAEFIKQFR